MNQGHPKPDPSLLDQKLSGVLLLKKPGQGESPSNWYLSKIAGVPFILRNLLTLQRVGIKNLAVFYEESNDDLQKSFDNILKDVRLSKKIVWISDIFKFKEWLQSNADPVYIFNGAFLYDKKELFTLIHSEPNNIHEAMVPINPDNLEDLLLKTENESIDLKPEASSGFPLYVAGSHELQIKKPEDFKVLHKAQLKKSGLSHDSPITRILSRPVSRFLTRMLVNTPLTPNQITLISFFVGLISAFLFSQVGYENCVIAALLLVVSTWIDGVDGEIARLKFMETNIGKKLDIYCDNIVHFLVFTAIGCGIYLKTAEVLFLYLGGLAGFGGLLSFFLLSPVLLEKRSSGKQLFHISEPELAEKFANRDFIHFLLLVSLIDQLEVFIVIAAVGANIFAGYLLYSRILKLKTA
tara:strand:- start:1473 stop:2699 length:1227 start_codon:yes stop_codon:yes gene_type:complete